MGTAEPKVSQPIYIYQMGKVASTSIWHSIEGSHHKHTAANLFDWELDNAKIITGTRDPIDFTVSSLFQNLTTRHMDVKNYCNQIVDKMYQRLDGTIDESIKSNVLAPLFWFDEELKHYTGVDVFSVPYTPPYTIIGDVFVYRLEDVGELDKPLSDFTGQEVQLYHANDSARKGGIFQEIKQTLKIPQDIQDVVYSHKGYTHFYGC